MAKKTTGKKKSKKTAKKTKKTKRVPVIAPEPQYEPSIFEDEDQFLDEPFDQLDDEEEVF